MVPERILPATVSFVDIAGIVKGASEGEAWVTSSSRIYVSAAIAQVVRALMDVIHVDGKVNPPDMETINTEA